MIASAALLGVVGKADSPPVEFLPAPWRGWLLPIGFLIFQDVLQHLGYFLVMASQICLICKITRGIRSDIESPFLFWCLQCFGRRLWSGQRIFSLSPYELDWFISSDILGGLCSCRQVLKCLTTCREEFLSGWSWMYQISPLFSGFFRISWKDYFAIASNAPGSLFHSLCCSHLNTKKV